MDAKNIDISLNDRILTMKGERKQAQEEKEKNITVLNADTVHSLDPLNYLLMWTKKE